MNQDTLPPPTSVLSVTCQTVLFLAGGIFPDYFGLISEVWIRRK
jgi:hypothetical protein